MSNTAPRHNQEPQTSKQPRQSKSEKRLLREAAKEQKFNEDKEKLISIHKSIEIQKTPLTNQNPINNKNPDSIMQKNMQWIADKKDNIGRWSWGVSRDQIDQDFNEISSFLNSLTSNRWYEILSQRSGEHYKHHEQEVFSIEKEAIERWAELGLEEFDTAFRFRSGSTKRIWGYKIVDVFHLIWWDPNHKIYPTEKKHT